MEKSSGENLNEFMKKCGTIDGDCHVEKCSFERISTSREDRELFTCSDTKGKSSHQKHEYDRVDHDSWSGLVFGTDRLGVIIIGSFDSYIEDADDD